MREPERVAHLVQGGAQRGRGQPPAHAPADAVIVHPARVVGTLIEKGRLDLRDAFRPRKHRGASEEPERPAAERGVRLHFPGRRILPGKGRQHEVFGHRVTMTEIEELVDLAPEIQVVFQRLIVCRRFRRLQRVDDHLAARAGFKPERAAPVSQFVHALRGETLEQQPGCAQPRLVRLRHRIIRHGEVRLPGGVGQPDQAHVPVVGLRHVLQHKTPRRG